MLLISIFPQILRGGRNRGMDKLQWGSRKRLRCVKVKGSSEEDGGDIVKKRITSLVDRRDVAAHDNIHIKQEAQASLQSPNRLNRELGMNRSNASENRKMSISLSSEKEDRYYSTRGSGMGILDDNSKLFMEAPKDKRVVVWPKLLVALSSKEKEEDFMAMKGCKLPQRPKKRAKLIQKTLFFVSPGQWLSDLCQERYEVREKKTSKKRPRGLKAMGSMETDSD